MVSVAEVKFSENFGSLNLVESRVNQGNLVIILNLDSIMSPVVNAGSE